MVSAVAFVAIFIVVFVLSFVLAWLRRLRRARLASVRSNPPSRRLSNAPKPRASPPGNYSMYHQTGPPAPPPVHTPQYPPRGYETYHGHLQPQMVPPSSIHIPRSMAPVSPASTRAPSGTTSRPISSVNPTPLSVRSSVYRSESTTLVPSTPTSPSHMSPPLPSSPPPRSPSVMAPPPTFPPPSRPSAATSPPRDPPLPLHLAPMSTGASYVIDEPPPAYTPI